MKTTMKQLAAGTFIALLLLVGNVNAEGTETRALIHKATETTLEVEEWMTNETIWNTNSFNFGEYLQETESNLTLENWMINEDIWNSSYVFAEEAESALELECWMTCKKVWNNNNDVEETETELTVENWMISEMVWNW